MGHTRPVKHDIAVWSGASPSNDVAAAEVYEHEMRAATMDTALDSPGGQMAVIVDPATETMTRLAEPVSDYARVRPPQGRG